MSVKLEFDQARLRALSLALVVVAVAALSVLIWREFQVRDDVYASILEDKAVQAARDIDAFFGPIQVQLEAFRAWGEDGDLDLSEPARAEARFVPLLRPQRWAAEMAIAGEDGLTIRLRRVAEGWVRDPDPAELKRSEWYRLAITDHEGRVHWVPTGDPEAPVAFHGSISWSDAQSGLGRVVALGASRAHLDSLIASFPVTENGAMALLSDDGTASWHAPARGPHFVRTSPTRLLHPANAGEGLVAAGIRAWSQTGSVDGEPFRFHHEGESWWGWRAPLDVGGGSRDLLMLLPGSDLSDRLMTVTSPLTYGLLALFGVCVVVLFRVTLGFRGRIERMTSAAMHADSDEPELRALIESGESDRLEFKSTLRWNLRENRPGREIEFSWLKTVVAFLNTEGGTLLIGVADNGTIVGTGKDGFRNDDKYLLHVNNLLTRHIGVEFIRYLRYDLKPMGERSILVVDVLPADEPAFLRNDDDDQFYVRMGPASKKLSLRKTFEYIREFKGR
jgi:hypothetical protein